VVVAEVELAGGAHAGEDAAGGGGSVHWRDYSEP
jgi:hypothetical protein